MIVEKKESVTDKVTSEPEVFTNITFDNNEKNILPENKEYLLTQTLDQIEQKNYSQALEILKEYFLDNPQISSVAYYYMGNIFESESNVRNIKEAVKNYQILLSLYPESEFWNDAEKKVIYLKQFYY